MTTTSIEWCDRVWNPTVGCSRVSRGCERCFAERVAHRGMLHEHKGLTVLGKHGPRWTGEVRFLADRLAEPLSWRKPRRVFVNSMSDLFHESLPFETIAAIFGVMAGAPHHTFQVLTKRPERAQAFLEWAEREENPIRTCVDAMQSSGASWPWPDLEPEWPLTNVWLGVSVEDQSTADERIPHLLACPAAVRWVSYEPALGPVRFDRIRNPGGESTFGPISALRRWTAGGGTSTGIDWIVVGGESGPGARPFDLAWARSVITQCREAGVPCFVKQLGAHLVADCMRCRGDGIDPMRVDGADPVWCIECGGAAQSGIEPHRVRLDDRKGGDMAEWPPYLRVREWPKTTTEETDR